MLLIESGTMHNFVSAALVQAMKATTIYAEPMYITLGKKIRCLALS